MSNPSVLRGAGAADEKQTRVSRLAKYWENLDHG